jgi:hypothetical protein
MRDFNSLATQQANCKSPVSDIAPIKAAVRDIDSRLGALVHKLASIEDAITGPSPMAPCETANSVPPDHIEAALDRISGKLASALNHAERIQKQLV